LRILNYEEIKSHFTIKQQTQDTCKAVCPAHSDKEASLSISYDSKGHKTLIYCHAGCETRDVLEAVGLKVSDLFDKQAITSAKKSSMDIKAIYEYKDEAGKVLFEKIRYATPKRPKNFTQRRAIDGHTVWGLEAGTYYETYSGSDNWSKKERKGVETKEFPGTAPVLYRLPELIQAVKDKQPVFIVEGEKDVDNLVKLGFVATCNFDGASRSKQKSKWHEEYNKYFKDANVIIIPDNDNPGHAHMDSVRNNLINIVSSLKRIDLSVPEKNDISDWLEQGHTKEELESIIKNTENIKNQAHKTEQKRNIMLTNYNFSDVGNAERLIAVYGMNIRFSHIRQKFFIWDNKKWGEDNCDRIYKLAKNVIRQLQQEGEAIITCGDKDLENQKKSIKSFVLRSENDAKIKAMVNQVKSQPEAIMQETNNDLFILNLKNGELDLKTGKLKEHNRFDYITKLVNIDYDPEAKCENWTKFLETIFEGDKELIEYVQKSIGYSLTGSIDEQCFYMLYGNGANGKSTFLNAIRMITGDYADSLKGSSLMTHYNDDGARGDLAKLQGKRFVVASELNEGQTFDESLMKSLTGGDTIPVRYLYGEEFPLKPQFKIWIGTNEKPRIKGSNYGIWRRVRLIPFTHTFTDSEKDEDFFEKCLVPELSGILNWAVEGCLAWQKEGIKTPAKVMAATDDYKDEMDVIQQFIDDCCFVGEKYTAKVNGLYEEYCKWCDENNVHETSSIKFTKKLKDKGFTQTRNSFNRYWSGIGIVDQQSKPVPYQEKMNIR
jgi:putative DNA primase/helicase